MKISAIKKLAITTFILTFMISSTVNAAPEEETFPPGFINFVATPVGDALRIYKDFTSQELVMASNVKHAPGGITLKTERALTKSEATKLLEQALLEQAAVIITRLDEKRVSVTYNDALKIRPAQPTQSK
jgi:type II secretory pathway component GspD/PulD (secretin)